MIKQFWMYFCSKIDSCLFFIELKHDVCININSKLNENDSYIMFNLSQS